MINFKKIQAPWKKVIIIIFTSITILSSAASCSLFGVKIGESGAVLGIIKRDPSIKAEGFGFINQEKLYTGQNVASGLAKSSGLKINLANSNTLYLLTESSGFFKTTDAGKTWERRYVFGYENTATEQKAIQNEITAWVNRNNSFKGTDFAVSPDNSEVVYIAGQFEDVGRIYKTQTGGSNFKQVYTSVEKNGFVRFITIDPQNTSNIYALVGADTIIRSTNGGDTWQKMQVFDNQTVVQLGFFAETSTSLFALVKNKGLSFSRDNGSTWETREMGKGKDILKQGGTDGGLFIGKTKESDSFGEYEKIISINNGQAWVLIADKQIWFSGSVNNIFQKIMVPTEAKTFSTYDIIPYPTDGVNRMMVGINNKLFETKDGGVTWSTDDKIGLQTTIGNIGQIIIDPNNTEVIYVMLVDTATLRKNGLYQRTGGSTLFG